MKELPKIAVCGFGAAGAAISADLALMGCRVNLFEIESFRTNVAPVVERGGIELTGVATQSGKTGLAKLNLVTTDPKQAIQDVDLIMISVPATVHEPFFDAIAPHLKEGQSVLTNTGCFASLRFADMLKKRGVLEKITLAEANIMPYLSAKLEPTHVHVYGVKRHAFVSAFPSTKTDGVFKLLNQVYPQYGKVPNVLWTNFAPGNSSVHATFGLPIASYYFDRNRGGNFYGEATTCGTRLVHAFDKERIQIADALGCQVEGQEKWMEASYGYKGKDLGEALRKSNHADAYMPATILAAAILEDILYFYIPLVEFGQLLGIPTPTTKALIDVWRIMLDVNYWEKGVRLKDLGLAGMNKEEIVQYVTTGR